MHSCFRFAQKWKLFYAVFKIHNNPKLLPIKTAASWMIQVKDGFEDSSLENGLFFLLSYFLLYSPVLKEICYTKSLISPFHFLPFTNEGQISMWWMYMERNIHLPSKTGLASQRPTASGHKTAQQGVSGGSSLKTLYQAGHAVTGSMTDRYLMRKSCHSASCSFSII